MVIKQTGSFIGQTDYRGNGGIGETYVSTIHS